MCVLYFGFCNLYYYYKEFNIEIYSFISTTDILLIFFPNIVVFTSLIYFTILTQLYDSIKKPVPKKVIEEKDEKEIDSSNKKKSRIEWWRSNIYWFIILYYLPVSLLSTLLQEAFGYKRYELADMNVTFDIIFLGLIIIAISIHEKRDSFLEKPILIAAFLVIFIGQKIGSFRVAQAQKIKAGVCDYKKDHISFKYKNAEVKTSNSILFVGETATHIFLYNLKDKSTKVYPFENIEELTIK